MTFEHDGIRSFPLSWPTSWKRTRSCDRARGRFGEVSMSRTVRQVIDELRLLGAREDRVVISSNVELRLDGLPRANQRRPEDPGVAVYFRLEDKPRVLACDRWITPESNLRAIALHISAIRGQERWGVGSIAQAFAGYAALPDPSAPKDPRAVLGLPGSGALTIDDVEQRFRELALVHHPDKGGDAERFAEIVEARSVLRRTIGDKARV